jgi:hypothetical protein
VSWLGKPFSNFRKPRRNGSFARTKKGHVDRALAAAEHRAKSDHQQIVEVVQTGIAGSRVLQTFPTGNKLIQSIIPERTSYALR